MQKELRRRLIRNRVIRAYITVDANNTRESVDGIQRIIEHFQWSVLVFNSEGDIAEHPAEMMRRINAHSQDFEAKGSDWNLEEIINVQLHIVTYEPLSESSYIPSLPETQKTKAVLSIHNDDKKCIVWCILTHFHTNNNNNSTKLYAYCRYEAEINVA